jgi:hypothetical protein
MWKVQNIQLLGSDSLFHHSHTHTHTHTHHSASITISSRVAGSTFPFHTETDYEITGGFVDGMGGIMAAAYAPLVKAEEIDQWEEYANANQDWVENSKYLEQANALHRDALHGTIQDHEHNRRLQSNETESISKEIFRWENGEKVIESSQPGQILAPLWQVSPADYSAVNANLLSDPRIADLYETMVKADHAVMSSSTEIKDVVRQSSFKFHVLPKLRLICTND